MMKILTIKKIKISKRKKKKSFLINLLRQSMMKAIPIGLWMIKKEWLLVNTKRNFMLILGSIMKRMANYCQALKESRWLPRCGEI